MVDRIAPFEGNPGEPITGTKYHVNKLLAERVNKLIAEAPPEVQHDLIRAVSSGERTREQQTMAYLHHLAGGGLAARPGHSWHERLNGMAVDWNNITPRAWAYLRTAAPNYSLGFPLGSRDPYHMQPIETYAGGVNRMATMQDGKPLVSRLSKTPPSAPPPPLAYDDMTPLHTPTLPVEPIAPVPPPSQEPHTITTKPMPIADDDEPLRRIVAPHTVVHQPALGGAFRQAINNILRTK